MRYYQILLFVGMLLPFLSTAQNKYWLETTPLDSLVVVEADCRWKARGSFNQTQFNFEISDPKQTYLIPYCSTLKNSDITQQQLSFKVKGEKEDAYTRWFYLPIGDTISMANLFELYAEVSALSILYDNVKAKAIAFLKSLKGGGRITIDQLPVMKSSDSMLVYEQKLHFKETNNFRFYCFEDFAVSFRTMVQHRPIRISINRVSDEFCMLKVGQADPLNALLQIQESKLPPLSAILDSLSSTHTDSLNYQLRMEKITPYLNEPFVGGTFYQLLVKIAKVPLSHNTYLFNFQFFKDEDWERLISFISE